MTLPITLTFAAAAALIHIWLSVRVSQLRRRYRISIGDGNNQAVRTRMRSHSNFAENTPIFLILLALVEMARGSVPWLWVVAIVYILARIAHAFGMDRTDPSRLRVIGVVLSWLVLLILAGFALYLATAYRPAMSAMPVTPVTML
jgi:uncharacterized protein